MSESSPFEDFTFDFEDVGSDISLPEPIIEESVVESISPEIDMTDDAAVNAAFEDIAASTEQAWENDIEVQKSMALVIEAEAMIAAEEIRLAELKAESDELIAERKELEEKLRETAKRQDAIRSQLWDKGSLKRALEHKLPDVKKQVAIAKKAVESRMVYERRGQRFDRLASNKAWYKGLDNGYKILAHQWEGAKFLASAERAILGDGMGLGKTLTAIAALDLVESKRALVVTPADLTSNFTEEIRMWAPHRVVIDIHGMTKVERNIALTMVNMLEEVVVVVNYEAWRKDLSLLTRLGDLQFDSVIMDEAHNVKTTSGDAYKGCKEFVLTNNTCPVCPGHVLLPAVNGTVHRQCAVCNWAGQSFNMSDDSGVPLEWEERYWFTKSVKRLWTMTGTPILNKPQDIYSMLSLIDPLNFDVLQSFLRSYCDLDQYTGKWKFRSGGAESLTKRLTGRYLARNMHDAGIILPEQKPILHELVLDPMDYKDQARVIKMLSEFSEIVLSDGRSMPILAQIALITRQRQANVFPGGIECKDPDTGELLWRVSEEVTESIKIDKVLELIDEFVGEEGKRVVVFSQFKTGLAEIERRLNNREVAPGEKKITCVRFDGSTSTGLKEEVKHNFNKSLGEEAKWDVVLANYKTGGTGLNLTECEHTIIMDEEWNPGKRDQAYARTQRIGQDKETFVHILRIPKTVDTWLANLIQEKEDIIGGFDSKAADMQAAYLKALKEGLA